MNRKVIIRKDNIYNIFAFLIFKLRFIIFRFLFSCVISFWFLYSYATIIFFPCNNFNEYNLSHQNVFLVFIFLFFTFLYFKRPRIKIVRKPITIMICYCGFCFFSAKLRWTNTGCLSKD